MTYPLNPAAVPDFPSAVTAAIPDSAAIRIGRVTRYDAGYITVAISDSDVLVDAAYLFGQYQPALGDNVAVIKQGNQWLAIGTPSPNPDDNKVLNYSFEDGDDGAVPPNWTLYHHPSSSDTADVERAPVTSGWELDGPSALLLGIDGTVPGSIASSMDYVTSDPIPVDPDSTWTASAWVVGQSESGPYCVRGTASLYLSWYASAGATYPDTVTFDSLIATGQIPTTLPWVYLRQAGQQTGYQPPAGATHMRVLLFTLLTHEDCVANYGLNAYWDRVIARQLS